MSDAPTPGQPLDPPAAVAELVLTPPQPVVAVPVEKVGGMVPLDQAALPALDQRVADFVAGLAGMDPHSPAFGARAEEVRTMGDPDIRAAANVSNRMLQAPMRDISRKGFREGSKVAGSLVELRHVIEDLDPAQHLSVHGLLARLPLGNKVRAYFARYQSAQSHIDAILQALYGGQDELRKDNAALEQEKANLWETMQRLSQYIYLAQQLDAALVAQIAEVEPADPERAKALREEILFSVRQKHQDLLTQLAVSIQSYLAIDLIRKNNIELIKGVDRATTTTVSALRTAVIVAQALADQKIVLDQMSALNTTTSELIQSASHLLAGQSVAINQQASSSSIGIDKLQTAFTNVYQTIDAIDRFKVQALGAMATTIDALEAEVADAQTYLSRARASDPDSGPSELSPGPT